MNNKDLILLQEQLNQIEEYYQLSHQHQYLIHQMWNLIQDIRQNLINKIEKPNIIENHDDTE